MHFSTIIYRSDLVIPDTKSSLYVEEFFEFSDKLSGPVQKAIHACCSARPLHIVHSSYVITVEPSASIYPSKHLIAICHYHSTRDGVQKCCNHTLNCWSYGRSRLYLNHRIWIHCRHLHRRRKRGGSRGWSPPLVLIALEAHH